MSRRASLPAVIIYGQASSRTRRVLWTAEQAGAKYEFRKVALMAGEHLTEEYLRINPNGRVPAMVDGELVLFESAAICMYIAQKHPDAGLLPPAGSRAAALHTQWMFWIVTELEQPLWSLGKHTFALPKEYRIEGMKRTAMFEWKRAVPVLAAALAGRDHLVGSSLTVADIMVGHTLAWARAFKVPFDSDVLEKYLDKMMALPSYQATLKHD